MVKFSIIVVTFNGLEWTKYALKSLEPLSKEDYEILVVDNGSKDGTLEYLAENGYNTLPLGRNYGPGYAVNRGAEKTSGKYLIYFNNDMVLTDVNMFEHMSQVYEQAVGSGHNVGMVAPMMDYVSNPYQVCKYPEQVPNKIIDATLIGNGAALIPRDVWDKFGGYDERYKLYGYEDTDWCMTLLTSGYKIFVDGFVWLHHAGGKGIAQLGKHSGLRENAQVFHDKWKRKVDKYRQMSNLYLKLKHGRRPKGML